MDKRLVSTAPATTRERLVHAALQLFWERGYEATSVAEILDRAGANSGSLYYHFDGKDDLLLAVLDLYVELLWPEVIEPVFARIDDPLERIFGVLDGYRQGLIQTGCAGGCPIGNLALEVSDRHPEARTKIAANFDGWVSWIRVCTDDLDDRLPADVDRDELAQFVLTVMEGGVMQARAHRSLEPFDASVAQLRDYFDRLLGPGER